MMKYSVNHHWKFISWRTGFIAGLMQVVSTMLLEVVNCVVISTEDNPTEIVMDFMALVVISDFGQFFYSAFRTSVNWKDIITDEIYKEMLIIQTTTARGAEHKIDGNKIKLQYCEAYASEDPKTKKNSAGQEIEIVQVPYTYIKIPFDQRAEVTCNRFCFVIYKVFRVFYLSVWFYFLPFTVIVVPYHIPYLAKK